jgi:hypothetical protein
MAHFAYTAGRGGTAGDWPSNVAVTPAEFAWIAESIFSSPNFAGGGAYAPSSAIIIGGAGVQFTTVATSFFGITCSGNSVFGTTGSNQFTVNAVADFYAATSFHSGVQFTGATGAVLFSGGTSGTHEAIIFGPYLDGTVSGAWVFDGTIASNATVTFTSNSFWSGGSGGARQAVGFGQYYDVSFVAGGSVTMSGITQIVGALTITNSGSRDFSDTGHDNYRRYLTGDANYTMTTEALYDYVRSSPVTTNRTVTLPDDDTIFGFRVFIICDGTYSTLVTSPTGTVGYIAAAGHFALLQSIGSAGWEVLAYGDNTLPLTPS